MDEIQGIYFLGYLFKILFDSNFFFLFYFNFKSFAITRNNERIIQVWCWINVVNKIQGVYIEWKFIEVLL